MEVRRYSPILEYGGWGYRPGRKKLALNVSGNQGLEIKFRNGRKLMIGTQKREDLERVIRRLAAQITN